MIARRLVLLTGLFVFAVAIGEILHPGLIWLPLGQPIVYLLGGGILLYAYFAIRSAGDFGVIQTDTPSPELPASARTPGDDFPIAATRFLGTRRVYYGSRIREGLKAAAVDVLTRYDNRSDADARRLVSTGEWTDDQRVAAFLMDDGPNFDRLTPRIRSVLAPRSAMDRTIRRTVDAISSIAGIEPDPPSRAFTGHRYVDWFRRSKDGLSAQEPVRTNITTDTGMRLTHHWSGISVVALLGVGAGLIVREPAILLAGAVGIGFAAYARSLPLGEAQIRLDRTVSEESPAPGDSVEITVTVANEGTGFLPDVRITDGVPGALIVSSGSPRFATPLRAGRSATYSYTVTARRGRHTFDPAIALVRNLSASQEVVLSPRRDDTITCVPALRPVSVSIPLRTQPSRFAGGLETDTGGEGIAFHSTRRYQPGDAVNRIDWHRRARTGELATLEFHQERAAVVILVIDVQSSAYVSHEPHAMHAVDRSIEAAGKLFTRLLDDGHRVGIAAMGPVDCWLAPGTGRDHRTEGRSMLATDPAFSPIPHERVGNPFRWKDVLLSRFPVGSQVLVCSPLYEASAVRTIRQFEAHGHLATVLSPNADADRSAGHRLMRIHRAINITDLRSAGVPVVDWPPDATLDERLAVTRRHRAR